MTPVVDIEVLYRTGKYKTWQQETVQIAKGAKKEAIQQALEKKLGHSIHELRLK